MSFGTSVLEPWLGRRKDTVEYSGKIRATPDFDIPYFYPKWGLFEPERKLTGTATGYGNPHLKRRLSPCFEVLIEALLGHRRRNFCNQMAGLSV